MEDTLLDVDSLTLPMSQSWPDESCRDAHTPVFFGEEYEWLYFWYAFPPRRVVCRVPRVHGSV